MSNIQHTQEKYGIREKAKDFPMMCVISFVYVCNYRCPNCPYNNSDIRSDYKQDLFMPDEIFKKIADECGQYDSYIRISGGGEPMIHKHAVELMEYAKSVNARVGLISNGSLFTEESLTRLIKAQIDMIECSVDACDPETYNKVRPGGDFDVVVKNIKMAVKIRNELKSSTKIIVSAINQKGVNVDDVKKFWEPIVDNVQIRKYLTWGYNEDQSADDSPYLPPQDRIPCPWLFERLNIDTRGDVTICGEDIAFDEKFDNINNKSIKEIWHGPEFTEWRRKHLERKGDEIEICSKCPDWQYRSWQYNYWNIIQKAEEKKAAAQQQQ